MGGVFEFVAERGSQLGVRMVEHLVLTGVSTLIAILIGVPLGIWIVRTAWARGAALSSAGVLQTIPSLAMLAFLLPFLGIGAKPAIVALTLYALLPIMRNTFTAIHGVPAPMIEAAEGLGFSSRQRLMMVELPYALPVIVAGIRTAAVIGVGIATLSAFIGAGGLGTFINRGLALNDTRLVLLGAIPAAILALFIDFAMGVAEEAMRPGRKAKGLWGKAVAGAAVVVLALGFFNWLGDKGHTPVAQSSGGKIVIGSKNFTEQLVLGEIVAQLIEGNTSLTVERKLNLGGTLICHEALVRGDIDLYAEYTGTGLVTILKVEEATDSAEVLPIVRDAYSEKYELEWLEPFGFNNTYAITVREAEAQKQGWESISDLKGVAGELKAGFTSEFLERPDGYPGLSEAYGIDFGTTTDMDPSLMYEAIDQGEVDVICGFATDGRNKAYNLYLLRDDRRFFPPYEAAPVVRQDTLRNFPEVGEILTKLGGLIDDTTMQELNLKVDLEKQRPKDVAREFLVERGLISGD